MWFWVVLRVLLLSAYGVEVSLVVFCLARLVVGTPAALAFPCFLFGLLAFPLCGGAPTFLCLPQRKVGKRKRLKPLALKRVSWLGGGSGASGIRALAHSALVTRQSYFRQRCARRSGTSSNHLLLLA